MLNEFPGQLIVAEHHRYDEFEIPWTVTRSNFYWAGSIPHVRIDGIYMKAGASSCYAAAAEYRALIEQRLAETGGQSPVAITGGYWFDGDSLRVTASFRCLDADSLIDLQAHLMILEDQLYSAGLSFDHVTRAARSVDVELSAPGQAAIATAAFPIDPEWIPGHLSCAVCVQRMGSVNAQKDVHQAVLLSEGYAGVPGSGALAADPRLVVRPNPFRPAVHTGGLHIELHRGDAGEQTADGGLWPVALELHGIDGRCVARTSRLASAGRSGVLAATWDGRGLSGDPLPAGVYWVRVLPGGGPSRAGAATQGDWVSKRMLLLR